MRICASEALSARLRRWPGAGKFPNLIFIMTRRIDHDLRNGYISSTGTRIPPATVPQMHAGSFRQPQRFSGCSRRCRSRGRSQTSFGFEHENVGHRSQNGPAVLLGDAGDISPFSIAPRLRNLVESSFSAMPSVYWLPPTETSRVNKGITPRTMLCSYGPMFSNATVAPGQGRSSL